MPQSAQPVARRVTSLNSYARAREPRRRSLFRSASRVETASPDEALPRAGARLRRRRGYASAHRRRGEIRERLRHRRRVRLRPPAAGNDPEPAARTLRSLSWASSPMSRFVPLLAMVAAAWHGPALAQAPAWPQKPVRVLVGLAPGGNPDTLARMLASKCGEAFGQPFVVENRPGAGSTIAADLTAKSAPDGYTVLISDSSAVTTAPHLFNSLPYDPFRDLQAVSLAVVVPMWLVVHPSVAANSIQELLALAKSGKEPMPYASSGNGSIHHITMELFKAETGVNFTHVPFKGAGQSVPAMIAGDVKLGFIGYPAAAGAIKTGRLRVLAFSMARRSALTPEVP